MCSVVAFSNALLEGQLSVKRFLVLWYAKGGERLGVKVMCSLCCPYYVLFWTYSSTVVCFYSSALCSLYMIGYKSPSRQSNRALFMLRTDWGKALMLAGEQSVTLSSS